MAILTEEEKKKIYENEKKKADQAIANGAKNAEEVKAAVAESDKKAAEAKAVAEAQKAAEAKTATEAKTAGTISIEKNGTYDYTTPAQKRKQKVSDSVAEKATPTYSAKAVSSEAEENKYVPAAQKRKQATSDQVYENVLKGEAYLRDMNPENNGQAELIVKGLTNRLRSAGGETVENVARVIDDNIVDPQGVLGQWVKGNAQNVYNKNTAGEIGGIADLQLAKAKENTGDVGDFLINTADAGANMLSQGILSSVVPVPGSFAATQGISAGAQKYVDTREEGGSKAEAWTRGAATGAIAYATEKIAGIGKKGVSKIPGVNKVVTQLDEVGTKNWLTGVLTVGLEEGGEEGLEYAFEYASDVIADLIYKGEVETDFDVAELFNNVASGFVLGAEFGAVNGKPDVAKVTETAGTSKAPGVPKTPTEATVPKAENNTVKTKNEQEGTFANVGEQSKTEEPISSANTQTNTEKKPTDVDGDRLGNLFRALENDGVSFKSEDDDFFTEVSIAASDYLAYPGESNEYEVQPVTMAQAIEEVYQRQKEGKLPKDASAIQLADLAFRRAKWLEKNAQPNVQENIDAQPRAQGGGGFGTNTVGAAQSNPTSYAHLQNEHGVFDQGEQPAVRDPNVPKKDAQGKRVSQSVRTIMEASVTPDELIPAFEKEVAAGTFRNRGTSNQESVDKAVKRIGNKTFKEAIEEFYTLYDDSKLLVKDDLAFGEVLFSMAANSGETDAAMKIASLLVENNSKTGDSFQAQRLLKRLTPEGRLYHAEKVVDKFNKDNKQKTKIELHKETVEKILKAKTEQEIQDAMDAAAEDIAEQIDRGAWEDIKSMWNAWRYFSMLGNPRTHIRNIFGNLAFLPARKVKNIIKAGIEDVAYKAKKIDEKTASVKRASKENIEFAKENFEKNKKNLLAGGNYRFESEIEAKLEPFRFSGEETKVKKFFNDILTPARKLEKGNSDLLEAEDVFFLKNAYIDSFTQYLTANNLDGKNLTEKQKSAAEDYAAKEAKKATYRDTSAIANMLEKLSNKELEYKGLKIKLRPLVDAVVPFRKTPINILSRAVEYSPIGLGTTLLLDGKAVKKGDITANEMIDHISSGLTGSGIYALGFALALKGVLTGGNDEDEKEKEFAKLQGFQPYALKIGDGTYTLDWLAPTAIPLFLGAETFRIINKEYGEDEKALQVAWKVLQNLDKIANPMLEMSMLQNLDSFLGSNYASEGNAINGLAQDLLASYVLQAVPTLSSQIAKTADGTRRNAYYVDKTDKIPDEWQIPLQRAMAKIPGLSQKLPAYVDAWGRTEKQSDNVAVRAFENFLSPGYYKKQNTTEADKMLKQLYADTGDSSVLPSSIQKYFEVGGERKDLSGKEYVEAQKEKGQTAYNMINQLIADKDFQKLSSAQKADIISDVYSYSTVKGKQAVSDYTTDIKWYENMEEAKKEGVSNPDYLVAKNYYNNIETKEGGRSKNLQMLDQLVADKNTSAKQDMVLMERVAGADLSKYKDSSDKPENILSAYNLIKTEEAKGGDGTRLRIVNQLIADKNTSAKEDAAFLENVLGADLKKYKSATNDPEEQLELYVAVSDDKKKAEDIEGLVKKGYSAEEALAKYNVGNGNKKYENGNFSGFGTKQIGKAEKLKAKGYSGETIAKAANAVTSLGEYGTKKSYSSYVKALESVGIKDKKFQQDFWNIYM